MGRGIGLGRQTALQLQTKVAHPLFKIGDALLLLRHRTIKLLQQILVEAQLDFDFGESGFIHGRLLFRRAHKNAHALAVDLLPGADLRRLAALGLAVNGNRTGGDQLLAATAAVGDAGQFQQVTQAHVVVAQSEFTGFQGQARLFMIKQP